MKTYLEYILGTIFSIAIGLILASIWIYARVGINSIELSYRCLFTGIYRILTTDWGKPQLFYELS